jgi:hypothetical protein
LLFERELVEMPDALNLYVDDSGTRNPNHDGKAYSSRDWFALGGILIAEADEGRARELHAKFCEAWNITYPLHSVEIRHHNKNFSWLAGLAPSDLDRFMGALSEMIAAIPCIGHACVIDRPGYDARYREKYGRGTWQLCRTAFSVIGERAAKIARLQKRVLRVFPEDGDKTANAHARNYYNDLRENGLPFAQETSVKYAPLTKEQLAETLYSFKFKKKSSPMMQLADLYLYPICRARYEQSHRPYEFLRSRKKLIDDSIAAADVPALGIKYSCFEKFDLENTKAGTSPGLSAASVTETS